VSALAEALVAAQAKAISALEKAYVAQAFEDDRLREQLDLIGCTDAVDQDYRVQSLDVLRVYGASAPTEAKPSTDNEPATSAQRGYLSKLLKERDFEPEPPGWASLTKARASEMIEEVKTGTYSEIPF
jgi:hypothetical protein